MMHRRSPSSRTSSVSSLRRRVGLSSLLTLAMAMGILAASSSVAEAGWGRFYGRHLGYHHRLHYGHHARVYTTARVHYGLHRSYYGGYYGYPAVAYRPVAYVPHYYSVRYSFGYPLPYVYPASVYPYSYATPYLQSRASVRYTSPSATANRITTPAIARPASSAVRTGARTGRGISF